MSKNLSNIINTITVLETSGAGDPVISGLKYDSRQVASGDLFFALPGLHADGARFIPEALERGARAVIHCAETLPPAVIEQSKHCGAVLLRVADPRPAMSPAAAAFYDYPSRDMVIIGVTGTEGKSTTVSLIWQLLRLSGRRAGFISTVDYCLADEALPNPEHQTTPEATTVQEKLAAMRDNGLSWAVVESSSHGLSPRTARLADVLFDVGVFMNVTQEHLEFHGTLEQYRHDKANLFRALDSHDHRKDGVKVPSFGVVNEEDPAAAYFRSATAQPVYGFSARADIPLEKGGLQAAAITSDAEGASFLIFECGSDTSCPAPVIPPAPDESFREQFCRTGGTCHEARINLPGAFNVYNTLAALQVVSRLTGDSIAELTGLLPALKPVKGRMTPVNQGQPFEVLVDYAHTPSSFLAVFPSLRRRVTGRIISLFGSGGERDLVKRPEQGRIASGYSDIVILSDEDPRGEDPETLLRMIAAGCTGKTEGIDLFIIPDRPAAIRKAFSLAAPGDLVLLLGKGHENSIIYRDRTVPYDEIETARTLLAEAGWKDKA